jgi:hypothetical protein
MSLSSSLDMYDVLGYAFAGVVPVAQAQITLFPSESLEAVFAAAQGTEARVANFVGCPPFLELVAREAGGCRGAEPGEGRPGAHLPAPFFD